MLSYRHLVAFVHQLLPGSSAPFCLNFSTPKLKSCHTTSILMAEHVECSINTLPLARPRSSSKLHLEVLHSTKYHRDYAGLMIRDSDGHLIYAEEADSIYGRPKWARCPQMATAFKGWNIHPCLVWQRVFIHHIEAASVGDPRSTIHNRGAAENHKGYRRQNW